MDVILAGGLDIYRALARSSHARRALVAGALVLLAVRPRVIAVVVLLLLLLLLWHDTIACGVQVLV